MRWQRADAAAWVWLLSAAFPVSAGWAAWALYTTSRREADLPVLAVAALALALGGLVAVPTRSGQRMSASFGVASALPFVFRTDDTALDVRALLAVYAGGLALLWVLRTARGDDQRHVLVLSLRSFVGFAAFAWLFETAEPYVRAVIPSGWQLVSILAVAAIGWFLVDVVLSTLLYLGPRRTSSRYRMLSAFKDFDAFAALVGSGALFGLAFPAIGWWALAVAVLPYAFAHGAFRRFLETKATYGQTIRALSQIPEIAGFSQPGHADRTAELAVAIAKELGLRPAVVDELEYAAQMHDIGRITLNEPSIIRMGYTDEQLAQWGSEIIGETPYLSKVATYVRRQYDSYRKPGEERDPDVPLPSRIIRVASAYDRAIREDELTPLEAMERLHQGSVYDFDPMVVASLRRVLESRGVFGHPSRVP